ncbi:MAG: hypothetical protein COB66_01870 [Coxiella sp. (in: Bacteria)]|nr:MAG: hypothetical protein COB66_01870 [Coxiella sp. (in: g-proteobacteria)]
MGYSLEPHFAVLYGYRNNSGWSMQSKHLQAASRKEPWSFFRLFNLIPLALLIVVVGVVGWLWQRMQDPRNYPIEHVKLVTQGQYIPQIDIRKAIRAHTHGGFFSLDIKGLKQGLLYDPWVKNVSIRRVWPNSLVVDIQEQQPLARWGMSGVLSTQGDVFYPASSTIPQSLPEIDGPMSAKGDILSNLILFSSELASLNLSVTKLVVSPRLSWMVWLNNGIRVNLCRSDVQNRFDEFVKLYPRVIGNRAQDVVSVNLCYPNGLAVRWKNGKAPQST